MKGFKTYFTFLGRNQLFTVVNVAGLAAAFAFILLIADMVTRQLTIDSGVKDVGRVYMFTTGNDVWGHYQVAQRFADRYPEIEDWSLYGNCIPVEGRIGSNELTLATAFVNKNFFDFFGYKVINGDAESMLLSDDNAVLTRQAALKLFGSEEAAMGQTVRLAFASKGGADMPFTVSGVVEEIDNSIFPSEMEVFVPIVNMKYGVSPSKDINDARMADAASAIMFFRYVEGADPNAKAADMATFLKSFFWPYMMGVTDKVEMLQMQDFYYSSVTTVNASGRLNQYDFSMVMVFLVSGIIILVMAVFNYASMNVAQTAYRAKEMATRRLLGSSRRGVFWRMIAESLLLTVVAFAIGLLVAVLVQPFMMELLGVKLDVLGDFTWFSSLCWLAFVGLLSLVLGFAPASILSGYNPLDVVKGTFRRKTKMVYLRVLNVVQGGLTIALVACSIYFGLQVYGVLNAPLGYEYGDVLVYPYNGTLQQMQTFRSEVEQLPSVGRVSFARGSFLDGGSGMALNIVTSDTTVTKRYDLLQVDSAFFDIFNVKIVRDRKLASIDYAVYVSENTMRDYAQYGLGTDKLMFSGQSVDVAGEFKDVKVRSFLFSENYPLLIQPNARNKIIPQQVFVEVTGSNNPNAVKHDIDRLYEAIVKPVSYESRWYADLVRDMYKSVINLNQMMAIFTCVALLISLLGLMAMNIYMISQRKRDIAVRKVFGSTAMDEQRRLMRFSLQSVFISLVIAIPLSLAGLKVIYGIVPYGDMPTWWIPVAAFAMVAALSLASVCLVARKAVNENPINNIKTE